VAIEINKVCSSFLWCWWTCIFL